MFDDCFLWASDAPCLEKRRIVKRRYVSLEMFWIMHFFVISMLAGTLEPQKRTGVKCLMIVSSEGQMLDVVKSVESSNAHTV